MFGLLLAIIYLAFISLGLPDSLLGSAWPVMYRQFGVPVSYAGIVTMIIASGTIISSLMSDRLTRRLGAGMVTSISVLMTAAALFGFSVSSSLWVICLWAVPYGLGAGAVDAALNNYVAVHCASRHMNWLHSFWGVGASVSPFIMSFSLVNGLGWQSGYRFVGLVQLVLTASLFLSLPLWEKSADGTYGGEAAADPGYPGCKSRSTHLFLLLRFGDHGGPVGQHIFCGPSRGQRGNGRGFRLHVLPGHHLGALPLRLYRGPCGGQEAD
jgi:MFS family permease